MLKRLLSRWRIHRSMRPMKAWLLDLREKLSAGEFENCEEAVAAVANIDTIVRHIDSGVQPARTVMAIDRLLETFGSEKQTGGSHEKP